MKNDLQTAIDAMEWIARRNEVAPIEARIAREALAALRSAGQGGADLSGLVEKWRKERSSYHELSQTHFVIASFLSDLAKLPAPPQPDLPEAPHE